jgi:ABC-type branched-subunit amino acid transport system substrate-binding protein
MTAARPGVRNVVLEAVRRVGSWAVIERAIELKGGNLPNRRDVLDAMQTITYVGLTGTYSFDHNGDALSPLMSIYQVHNGKWEYLQKLDATAAG